VKKPKPRPVGRPPLPPGTTRIDTHIRLAPETLARLRALAVAWGVTVTGAIEMLIDRAHIAPEVNP
jgi:hypothetical protein